MPIKAIRLKTDFFYTIQTTTSNIVDSSEFVLEWMVCFSIITLGSVCYSLGTKENCLQYLLCKWMKSYVQVGWRWIIHKEHLWELNYVHFMK